MQDKPVDKKEILEELSKLHIYFDEDSSSNIADIREKKEALEKALNELK